MSRLLVYHCLLFGSCGYAFLKGRTDARIIAATFLVGNYATLAARSITGGYSSVENGILIIDVLALMAFAYAAAISVRFWPMWVAGLQLTAMFGHLLKALDTNLVPLAYAFALRIWSYPMLIILAVGVWRNRTKVQHSIGNDPSIAGARASDF